MSQNQPDFEAMLSGLTALPDQGLPSIELPDEAELDDHARYDRATFAFETKNYGAAADLLEPLVRDNPGNSEVALLLARAYYHAARLGPAETVLRQMLERWPGDAYTHLLLARTLQRAGRAEEGAPHLKLAEAMGLDA
ncbi:tetratricopeptide repeat protein [Ornithinimicrobium panacihumi]|uniref:tetratricopeptide repeat protein n=1 Tax=Ornithinimicrobium panacihumi TaxID=2008449 RepID=UPI003F8B9688